MMRGQRGADGLLRGRGRHRRHQFLFVTVDDGRLLVKKARLSAASHARLKYFVRQRGDRWARVFFRKSCSDGLFLRIVERFRETY